MANKISGRTDISGSLSVGSSVISNSNRPILIVGTGIDTIKEVIFNIGSTIDATTHFGESSPVVDIVKTLIRNGVGNIRGICVGESGVSEPYETENAAYAGAYEKSLIEEDIMCIIIDKSDASMYSDLASHLVTAENNDIFRYAVVGIPAATVDTVSASNIAKAINSNRVFVSFPNVVDVNGTILDGVHTAAGIAAALVTKTNDPALPVSSVPIVGFGGVAMKLTSSDEATLTKAGITALYPDNSVPTIYRLVTTVQGVGNEDSIWHDATTILIADDILNSQIARLKANYKRTKNVSRILDSIKTDVITILENKEALEIIQNFDRDTVSVVKDPDDNYGALVNYEFQVITPLYTITIVQHMKI